MAQISCDGNEQIEVGSNTTEQAALVPLTEALMRQVIREELERFAAPSLPRMSDEEVERLKKMDVSKRYRGPTLIPTTNFSNGGQVWTRNYYTEKRAAEQMLAPTIRHLTKDEERTGIWFTSDDATIPTELPIKSLLGSPLEEIWALLTALAKSDGGKLEATCAFCQARDTYFHTPDCPILGARKLTSQWTDRPFPKAGDRYGRYMVTGTAFLHECKVDVASWGRLDPCESGPHSNADVLLYVPFVFDEALFAHHLDWFSYPFCFYDKHACYGVTFKWEVV